MPGDRAHLQQAPATVDQPAGERLIIGRDRAAVRSTAVRGSPALVSTTSASSSRVAARSRLAAREPGGDRVAALQAGGGAPGPVGVGYAAYQGNIEQSVAALLRDQRLDVADRQVEGMAQPRLDALARAQRRHRVRRARAGHQEGFGAALLPAAG